MSARASAASAYAQADDDALVRSALNAAVSQRQAVRAELAQGDSEELPQLRRLMRTVQAEVLDEQENHSEPTEALALAGASSLDTVQDACEEDLERPDWSVHFADTPLNVMEEAARKMMSRGAQGAPAWGAWREDLRAEGKDLAANWGKRDKNTRQVSEAPAASAPASAPTPTRGPKSSAALWDQEA